MTNIRGSAAFYVPSVTAPRRQRRALRGARPAPAGGGGVAADQEVVHVAEQHRLRVGLGDAGDDAAATAPGRRWRQSRLPPPVDPSDRPGRARWTTRSPRRRGRSRRPAGGSAADQTDAPSRRSGRRADRRSRRRRPSARPPACHPGRWCWGRAASRGAARPNGRAGGDVPGQAPVAVVVVPGRDQRLAIAGDRQIDHAGVVACPAGDGVRAPVGQLDARQHGGRHVADQEPAQSGVTSSTLLRG